MVIIIIIGLVRVACGERVYIVIHPQIEKTGTINTTEEGEQ